MMGTRDECMYAEQPAETFQSQARRRLDVHEGTQPDVDARLLNTGSDTANDEAMDVLNNILNPPAPVVEPESCHK
jgi:hypothetical protein